MKLYLFIIIINLLPLIITGQNKMIFEYDQSGNQIKRQLCLNCPIPDRIAESQINSESVEKNLLNFFEGDVISYYPNPVEETLYLKWQLVNKNFVSYINVYAVNGQLLKTYKNLELKDSNVLFFSEYQSGVYSVVLFYTNGESKAIKIIKI
ncbi:MAG: T9SS type A sorting domain-containing protein [Bacteroidetes bacterium]|nr:T9SS type A sorting domain-containing protein [Bacteroidota bacterium]